MTFRTAISGLNAATNDLDVTANNIANANTTGFKKARAEFADVYAVSNVGSSGSAIGQGVNTQRVAQQFTQGNISFTDKGLDLAINGEGFFEVLDSGSPVFTRAGAFGLDKNGFISDAKGRQLVGFQTDASNNLTGATGPLQINTNDIAPNATASVDIQLNLDSAATPPVNAFNVNDPTSFNNSTSLTTFDSLGNSHLLTLYYRKTGANTWEARAQMDNNAALFGPSALTFSPSGALTSGPSFGTTNFAVTTGANPIALDMNYTGTTQFGSPFGVAALRQDGFSSGRLSGLDVDSQGVAFARFTNGQSRVEGQVALAAFKDPEALSPISDTTWAETFDSGPALVGAPASSTLGLIQSGALEDSNTDLSTELVKLIIAQRNFQANAQVISTTDTVTQSIINIR